jgi:hypothetical protein
MQVLIDLTRRLYYIFLSDVKSELTFNNSTIDTHPKHSFRKDDRVALTSEMFSDATIS